MKPIAINKALDVNTMAATMMVCGSCVCLFVFISYHAFNDMDILAQ